MTDFALSSILFAVGVIIGLLIRSSNNPPTVIVNHNYFQSGSAITSSNDEEWPDSLEPKDHQ